MDIYHIWANIEGDISDIDFANGIKEFLSQLQEEGKIQSFRIMLNIIIWTLY